MENNFSTNLKYLRIQLGLTQEELAKKVDKDYSTIGKWELGQRSPIMTDVIKLSEIFGISISDLISKDLRFSNSESPTKIYTEEEKKEALKQTLKDKGFLNDNEEMSKEDFDRLIDFAKRNKDYIKKEP